MEEIIFGSESSGCESGWTVYLEHWHSHKNEDDGWFTYEIDDEEEDMSMISDASSGPQHFPYHSNDNNVGGNGKRQLAIPFTPPKQTMIEDFLDDDTASSPFNFSQQHEECAFEDHLVSGAHLQQNQWLQGN